MATLYDIKPAFQALLRPSVVRLASTGVTANQVTVAAVVLSLAAGAAIALAPAATWPFVLLPAVLLVRMALNAVDGMLAREHGMVSTLGLYLNEIGDVVSDLALILPFMLVAPFAPWGVLAFALAAAISEFAGILGTAAGSARRYDGPLGKSDRALALGIVAALIAFGLPLPGWGSWLFPLLALLALATTANRIRASVSAARNAPTKEHDHAS